MAEFTKNNARAKRSIVDGIKDHIIPHVRGKDHAFDIWDSLTNLYQCSNENKKMVLKEKLKSIKMKKSESVATYLTRITSVRDELVVIRETVARTELVMKHYRDFQRVGKCLWRGSSHWKNLHG